jgi:hypothetical protein
LSVADLVSGCRRGIGVRGKDAQRRRSLGCVKAEDVARDVEGRRDTASISATDHWDKDSPLLVGEWRNRDRSEW